MTLRIHPYLVCVLLRLLLGFLVLYQPGTSNLSLMIPKCCKACYPWLTPLLTSFLTYRGLSILMALTKLLLLLRHPLLVLAAYLLTLSLLMFFSNFSFLLPCGLLP